MYLRHPKQKNSETTKSQSRNRSYPPGFTEFALKTYTVCPISSLSPETIVT